MRTETMGGGTHLPPQRACLDLSASRSPADLAHLVCVGVLAAELSLIASLSAHTLVESHMKMNRA